MASVLWIPVFFSLGTFILYVLASNFPQHSSSASADLKFPTNLDDLQKVANFLQSYENDHYHYVLTLFMSAYLYKQTFAIPGSIFMNMLAGALFGRWVGFFLACTLTSFGAMFCYLLSKYCGKDYVMKYFPEKVQYFQETVEQNLDSLLFFLLFIRLFPMSPNWFVNVTSPIVNIPLHLFFITIFIGLMPYNFICVQTGCFLSEIQSLDDIFSFWTLLQLCGIAAVTLVPGFLIKRYHKHKQKTM